MSKNNFKSAILGYSPKDVMTYINYLSEDYSTRLVEKEKEHKEEMDRLYKYIDELKMKNASLKLENEKLKNGESLIVKALVNAEDYAKQMEQETDEYIQNKIDDFEKTFNEEVERKTEELEFYQNSINSIRNQACNLIENINAMSEDVLCNIESVEVPEEIEH